MALDRPRDGDQRFEVLLVEAGDAGALFRDREGDDPPPSAGRCSTSLRLTARRTISPVTLLIRNSSGVTSPPTTVEPRPQLALMATMLGSPLTGLQVNITPATSASTISCTATPIASAVCASPSRAR